MIMSQVIHGGGGSVAEGGPRVLVCDGAPEGLSTGLSLDVDSLYEVFLIFILKFHTVFE